MKQAKRNLVILNNQPALWAQVGFRGCFLVFAVIFLFVNVGVFANIPPYEREARINTFTLPEGSFVLSSHCDDQQPFSARAVLTEWEVADEEVGSENELDGHAPDLLVATLPASIKFHLHSDKSLLLQLNLASQKRETISLFVLHHSWKSSLL